MSSGVLLDTSGWLALLNSRDSLHQEARRVWAGVEASGAIVVITDWIIAEIGNGLSRTPARSRLTEATNRLQASPRGRLVWIDQDRLSRAMALYDQSPDKGWGLVDCASFVVMGDLGIREALTADRHFEQAGFRALLLRPRPAH